MRRDEESQGGAVADEAVAMRGIGDDQVRPTLARLARGVDRLIGPATVLAAGLLIAGWTLPVMTIRKLIFLPQRFSLLEALGDLLRSGEVFLFAIVLMFSIVLPAMKLIVVLFLWYGADARSPRLRRALVWLRELAKWSMLDVFVIALTVVAVKASFVSNVFVSPGLYVFVAAILLSMIVVSRIAVVSRRIWSAG